MTKKDIELLAIAFQIWTIGPWMNEIECAVWAKDLDDSFCLAEQIEATWRRLA